VEGKQIRRQGWDSKAEAQDALDEFKEELKNPKPVVEVKPDLTLAQAFERYFDAKARKRSLVEDRRQSEHLKAVFGADTPLATITASRISEYKAKRLATKSRQTGEPLSAAAVNRPLALLRHVLRLAHEEWEALPSLPESGWSESRRDGSAG
jgi:Arm DNA-binding domain